MSAGTVAVRCEPEGDGTRARVTYDLTALSDTADLAGLAREFGARMESWERMIAATL